MTSAVRRSCAGSEGERRKDTETGGRDCSGCHSGESGKILCADEAEGRSRGAADGNKEKEAG